MQKVSLVHKVILLSMAIIVFPASAKAQDLIDINAVHQCRALKNDQERLACFDQVFEPEAANGGGTDIRISRQEGSGSEQNTQELPNSDGSSTSVVRPSSDDVNSPDQKTAQNQATEGFGSERIKKKDIDEGRYISVAETIAKDRRGKLIVVLENGHIWRQLKSDTGKIYLRKDNPVIEIKRAALNSYVMKVGKAKRTIRVKRIK